MTVKATRRTAREWAIQMLTTADLNPPEDVRSLIDAYWTQQATVEEYEGGTGPAFGGLKRFAERLVTGVLERLPQLDEELGRHLEDWDISRLGTVERAVLRLGVWEMRFGDVPPPVEINECVDLVNWFSSPRSRTLVNGVLDKIGRNIRGATGAACGKKK